MPLNDDLLREIATILGQSPPGTLTSATDVADVYEAYIFGLVVEASKREGARVWYESIFGTPTTSLIFRTAPGRIFRSSTSPPYTHAVIEFAGKPELELHQGIYVSGKSGLLHECDVAVIFRSEAQTCRRASVNPRSAKMILGGECKCYSSGLGIGLARSFMGLTSDLTTDGRFFIANTSSSSVTKLLTHHGRKWEQEVVPSNTVVVNRLRAMFERVFVEFKAAY